MTRGAAIGLFGALVACAPVDLRFGHEGVDSGDPFDSGTPDAGLPCGGCAGLASLRCDADAGHCVECLADADCAAGRPACDPVTGRCVECVSAAHCAGSGKACDPVTHRCGLACTPPIGSECLTALMFKGCGAAGVCRVCDDTDDCRSDDGGQRCDARLGRCSECLTSADCAAPRPLCDVTRGRCAGCLVAADCGAGRVCDPASRLCLP